MQERKEKFTTMKEFLFQYEKTYLEEILSYTNGNILRAARVLNLSRDTIKKKIKKYSIVVKGDK